MLLTPAPAAVRRMQAEPLCGRRTCAASGLTAWMTRRCSQAMEPDPRARPGTCRLQRQKRRAQRRSGHAPRSWRCLRQTMCAQPAQAGMTDELFAREDHRQPLQPRRQHGACTYCDYAPICHPDAVPAPPPARTTARGPGAVLGAPVQQEEEEPWQSLKLTPSQQRQAVEDDWRRRHARSAPRRAPARQRSWSIACCAMDHQAGGALAMSMIF